MKFTATAEHYDRFMGRYTTSLAAALCDAADVRAGTRVLDVGCGPGGLTAELAARVGAANVAAVDPTPQFVEACRERVPGADVREGMSRSAAVGRRDVRRVAGLPRDRVHERSRQGRARDGARDPARRHRRGLHVGHPAGRHDDAARPSGTRCATCGPRRESEMRRPGTRQGDIAERFAAAGLQDVEDSSLTARADYTGFDDFWEPFTHKVGPSGMALAALAPRRAGGRAAWRAAMRCPTVRSRSTRVPGMPAAPSRGSTGGRRSAAGLRDARSRLSGRPPARAPPPRARRRSRRPAPDRRARSRRCPSAAPARRATGRGSSA